MVDTLYTMKYFLEFNALSKGSSKNGLSVKGKYCLSKSRVLLF